MTTGRSVVDRISRARHPRLLVLVLVGAVGVVAGAVLLLADGAPRPDSLGVRLAVLGALVLLFGATGYLAFSIFGRGFD